MNKRPLSVTIIGWLFIAVGIVSFAYHFFEFRSWHALQPEEVWVLPLRVLVFICGVFMLRGQNWARWLTIAWMGYHVILSAFHSWHQVVIHSVFLAVLA